MRMTNITLAQLQKVSKGKLTSAMLPAINRYADENEIDSPLLMAHFLCHMKAETEFNHVSESLNYTPQRLIDIFGTRRISRAQANELGRKAGEKSVPLERQKKIANIVYGGVWGKKNLGNTEPDDGWDFRGGGAYQLTGRANYKRFGDLVGIDLESNPELARDPETSVKIAAIYFKQRMRKFALKDDLTGATRALNGGLNGFDHRMSALQAFKKVLGVNNQKYGLLQMDNLDEEPTEDAPEETVAEDFDEPITDKHVISLAQTYLKNLNYAEVGDPDGEFGEFTKTAVLSYRETKGLPLVSQIDFRLMGTLATDTEPRKIDPKRANATAAEVRAKVPEVASAWKTKITAFFSAAGAAAWGLVEGVLGKFEEAKEYVAPVKDLLSDVPGWAWAVAAFCIAVVLYRMAAQSERAGIEAVQTGARR